MILNGTPEQQKKGAKIQTPTQTRTREAGGNFRSRFIIGRQQILAYLHKSWTPERNRPGQCIEIKEVSKIESGSE